MALFKSFFSKKKEDDDDGQQEYFKEDFTPIAKPTSKKKAEPKAEEVTPSINKADSRVGMSTYARGSAYDPNRYPTFPYRDPSKAAPAEENNENKE